MRPLYSIPDDRAFATIATRPSPASRHADHSHARLVIRIRGRLLLACCTPKDRVGIYVPLHARRPLTPRAFFTHGCRVKRDLCESFRRRLTLSSHGALLRSTHQSCTRHRVRPSFFPPVLMLGMPCARAAPRTAPPKSIAWHRRSSRK
jgi:hypothetical protein